LSKGRNDRAPSSGGFVRRIVEDLKGGIREMGFGVEVDEVMRKKRNCL